ncbi:MAG: chemotaxis protein CheB [Bdellovibrionaceae bacterium]|nr:chemotaxis protein CheB [Pseudobdellovibrionaceae bacterium]
MNQIRMIALGASAGGVGAINQLLDLLPDSFRIPVVVVQHLPASATVDVNLIFGRRTKNRVAEATDKLPVESGHIYFAPPAYHLLVESDGTLALSQDDPVKFSRPSIDVFFESAARAYGKNLAGIILTGANNDGAQGMKAIQQSGGLTIVQDPKSAEVATMPEETLKVIRPDHVLDLPAIAKLMADLSEGGPRG